MRDSYIIKTVNIWLVLVMAAMAQGAGEPNSVGEILKGNKLDWIAGEWEGVNDANEKAEAKFEFAANDYVLSVRAKVGKYEYEGMVYYVASKNTIVNVGVDNSGRSFGGSWMVDGDKILFKIEQTSRNGCKKLYDRYMSRVDAETMKSLTYSVSEGKRSDEPISVMELKRKK